MQDLFTQALGINSPWFIKDVSLLKTYYFTIFISFIFENGIRPLQFFKWKCCTYDVNSRRLNFDDITQINPSSALMLVAELECYFNGVTHSGFERTPITLSIFSLNCFAFSPSEFLPEINFKKVASFVGELFSRGGNFNNSNKPISLNKDLISACQVLWFDDKDG
jgi:hypothetical protein